MSNEWYTPSKYIEAAREVMGTIDLDPASCALANKTVQATTYYTQEQNGLTLPWHGNVWLNPPYGRMQKGTGTSEFIAKLIEEYTKGNTTQAIVFSMLGTHAAWFFRLLQYRVCFLSEKPVFSLPDGTSIKHKYVTGCTYLGSNEQKFRDVFSQFGHVVMPERVVVS